MRDTNVTCLRGNSRGELFAGTSGQGVYRSNNAGVTWNQANDGLTDTNIRALVVDSSGTLFAGTFGGGVFKGTVATLVNGEVETGRHQVQWEAVTFPSGTYFCVLDAGGHVLTPKVVLAR